ncbi:sensor histidine kinase [Rhodopseudomonas palustris]|uniref:Histidine kinase internal region n=1 Tax=Rhodopseudomonas palustris (strain BisB18) TaxID=316056 RepID=Q21A45_RHOPB
MDAELLLEDLISVDALQKVQDNFSAAVGIAMIMVDAAGAPVTKPSGFSAFCQAVRTSADKRDQCFHCDDEGGRIAMAKGEPSIYRCHAGLVDFAAPIVVRGQYLGAILSGQVRLRDESAIPVDYIHPPDDWWRQDDRLRALREKTTEVAYQKLRAAAFTSFHLATYLVEESYAKAVSEELGAENLRLMAESKRRMELEKLLREAELQALSYQVNPHFLFNVLNTIGRLALKENAKQTETMLYAFADMMRYVLKKSRSQIVSFHSELEHVQNYLNIQKVRMGDRLSFTLNVHQKYGEIRCPFMVVHPIVENCIHYAIEPKEKDGWIEITARDDGKDMILEITDNGDGIAPDMIPVAISGVADHHGRTSIGLHNIDSRLRHFFGDDYKLKVESRRSRGGGTWVQMRFPLKFDGFHA